MKVFLTVAVLVLTNVVTQAREPHPIDITRPVETAHGHRVYAVPYSDGTIKYCYWVPREKLADGCTYDPMGQYGALPSPCCKGWTPRR